MMAAIAAAVFIADQYGGFVVQALKTWQNNAGHNRSANDTLDIAGLPRSGPSSAVVVKSRDIPKPCYVPFLVELFSTATDTLLLRSIRS